MSTGFKKDCEILIQRCVQENKKSFEQFGEIWKSQNFCYIFSGFRSDIELIENIVECYNTIKKLFFSSTDITEQIICIYLLYTIYFKQPAKEMAKIRFTMKDTIELKKFYAAIEHVDEFEYIQVKFIYWKLLSSGAIQFCEYDREYTFEYFMTPQDEVEEDLYGPTINNELDNLKSTSNGIVTGLNLLEEAYNEMKDLLGESNSTLALPLTSIISDLEDGFKEISNIFELNRNSSDSEEYDEFNDEEIMQEQIENRRKEIKRKALLASSQKNGKPQQKNSRIKKEKSTDGGETSGAGVSSSAAPTTINQVICSADDSTVKIKCTRPVIVMNKKYMTMSRSLKSISGIGALASEELKKPISVEENTTAVGTSLGII